MHNSEVLEIFPTPLYTAVIPDHLSSVIPFLNTQDMNTNADEINYGSRSSNSYILNTPECIDLRNFILECVQDFGDNTLMYDYDSYRFTQSWISHKHPGQHHTIHSHANSLISGCFYYGYSESSTPAIKFHKFQGGSNYHTLNPKMKPDKRSSKSAHSEFLVDFHPGLLLLFPSYLPHSVPLNETNYTRCSLAFNVVPTIGFGSEDNLTELLF